MHWGSLRFLCSLAIVSTLFRTEQNLLCYYCMWKRNHNLTHKLRETINKNVFSKLGGTFYILGYKNYDKIKTVKCTLKIFLHGQIKYFPLNSNNSLFTNSSQYSETLQDTTNRYTHTRITSNRKKEFPSTTILLTNQVRQMKQMWVSHSSFHVQSFFTQEITNLEAQFDASYKIPINTHSLKVVLHGQISCQIWFMRLFSRRCTTIIM